jgi:hypothetical protein
LDYVAELHDRTVVALQGMERRHMEAHDLFKRLRGATGGTNLLATFTEMDRQANSYRGQRAEARRELTEPAGSFSSRLTAQHRVLGVRGLSQGGISGETSPVYRVIIARALAGLDVPLSGGGLQRLPLLNAVTPDSVVLDVGCGEGQVVRTLAALLRVKLVVGIEIGESHLVNADLQMRRAINMLQQHRLELRSLIKLGIFNAQQEFEWAGITHAYAYSGHVEMAEAICNMVANSTSLMALLVVCPQLAESYVEIMPFDELSEAVQARGYGFRPASPNEAPLRLVSMTCQGNHAYKAMLWPVTRALRKHAKKMIKKRSERQTVSGTPRGPRLQPHTMPFMDAVNQLFFTYK